MGEKSGGAEVINLAEQKLNRAKTLDEMSEALEELRKQNQNEGVEAFGKEYFVSLRQRIIRRQAEGKLSTEEARELFDEIAKLKREMAEKK